MVYFIVYFLAAAIFASAILLSYYRLATPENALSKITLLLAPVIILVAALTPGLLFDATTYLGDLWTAFEAINKTASGVHSSVDYFNPIGPMYEWVFAFVEIFRSPSVASLPMANAVVALISFSAVLLLYKQKESPEFLFIWAIIALMSVTTAISPRDIDTLLASSTQSSFLAPYNRWAWALYIPVVAWFCLPNQKSPKLYINALVGVVIGLLIFTKITYGLAALGFVALSLVFTPKYWKSNLVLIASLAIFLLLVELVSGQLLSYLKDLATASKLPNNGIRIYKLSNQIGEYAVYSFVSLSLLFILTREKLVPQQAFTYLQKIFVPCIFILAAGGSACVILMQNHYISGSIIYPIMPLLAIRWAYFLTEDDAKDEKNILTFKQNLVLLAVALMLFRPIVDAAFILNQPLQLLRFKADPALANTPIEKLVVHRRHLGSCSNSTCIDYQRMLTGKTLLNEAGISANAPATIMTLNFSNPFPLFLGTPSPKFTPIWTHDGRSFSPSRFIPAEKFLGDVDAILVAKNESNAKALFEIYSDYINVHYTFESEDKYWTLFLKQ